MNSEDDQIVEVIKDLNGSDLSDGSEVSDEDGNLLVLKENKKSKMPFTPFKSQIENNFIEFLRQSLYSQDLESNGTEPKKNTNISLKQIFQDSKVQYIYGDSFASYSRENFWEVIRNREQMKRVIKTTKRYLQDGLPFTVPPLKRNRIESCIPITVNY